MRALINAFIIHLTLNVLMFIKGWNVFEKRRIGRTVLIIVFGLELLIYTFGFIFYRYLPPYITHNIRLMGTGWMLFLLYAGGIILLLDVGYLLWKRSILKPKILVTQSRRTKLSIFFSSVFITVLLLTYGSYKFMHPSVNEVDISLNKPAEGLDSLRIAVVGDMHLGYLIDKNDARRFVDLIMAQQPDMIVMVGDIFDSYIEPVVEQRMNEELMRLRAPLGVFACMGNHEHRHDTEEKVRYLVDAGITMLRDSAALVNDAFYVVGREDLADLSRLPTSDLLEKQQVDMSKPVIVLSHNPYNLSEEADAGADIALYGHTHDGQAFPGNIIVRSLYEVSHGYKKKGDTHVYVTSGIGIAGPQYRIGTVSEIAILNVKFGK